MSIYRIYELDDKTFEKLVGDICSNLLGQGFTTFAEGKDGGRDGVFRGTANELPSSANPFVGHTIAQAKHTTNPVASCSDNNFFETILDHELVRLNKITLDNYFIVTNRKLTGGYEQKIHDKITSGTKIKNVVTWGVEKISLYLDANKGLATRYKLDKQSSPIHFSHMDLSKIISEFANTWNRQVSEDDKTDFTYVEIEKKNIINGLTEDYFNYIKQDSDSYFWQITEFLANPINENIKKTYIGLADELKGKLIIKRNEFESFDEAIEYCYQYGIDNNTTLSESKKLLKVFIHFMYCNCDIGKKDA